MNIIFEMDVKEEKEEWKKVKNYPYKVSNFGRVKRIKSGPSTYVGKILKPQINTYGYLCVRLWKDGKGKTKKIHKLVSEAFIGPCPENKEVNHIDGDKKNPRVDNLEYVTVLGNRKHAYKIGLRNDKGENNGMSKLDREDILKIRKLHKTGNYIQEEIAKKFSVSRTTINFVVNKKAWKHIK